MFEADAMMDWHFAVNQDPPVAVPSAGAPDQVPTVVEEIIVVGTRPSAWGDIDRRTYRIVDPQRVEALSAIELLPQLPSVTVTSTGRVQLLGNPGVTILIDGGRPTNADATLRALPASQIERVEVMTNPSAQYGAQGTAGIINIITVKVTPSGWTGSATISGNELGGAQVSVAPSLTRDNWTVSLNLLAARVEGESASRTSREVTDGNVGVFESLRQIDESASREDRIRVSSTLRYRVSDRKDLSISGEALLRSNDRRSEIASTGSETFYEQIRAPDASGSANARVEFEARGPLDGELLKLSASAGYSDWLLENEIIVAYAGAVLTDVRYNTEHNIINENVGAQLEYARPLGSWAKLSTGISWSSSYEGIEQSLTNIQGAAPSVDFANELSSRRSIGAVYGSIQFAVDKWTVRPGVRVEYDSFTVDAIGAAARINGIEFFPSLHVLYPFNDEIMFNASYSRRVNRPDAQRISPYIFYINQSTARSGNPALRPEFTESLEVRADYKAENVSLGLTAYGRRSSDIWSESTSVLSDGVLVGSYMNTGNRLDFGAEFSARGAVGQRLDYTLAANVFLSRQDVLSAGVIRPNSDISYTLTAQIDYEWPGPDGAPSDKLQLTARYLGPREFYDRRISSFTQVDLTWRRPISDRVSFVATVSDVFDSAATSSRLNTSSVREWVDYETAGTTVRVSIVYRWE